MVRPPKSPQRDGPENPSDFPNVTPRDLHPTSDIRFVMVEIGKLNANVDRLITDVSSQAGKIDDLRHQVSFVKGAVWVAIPLILLFITVLGFLLSAKGEAVLQAIKALAPK